MGREDHYRLLQSAEEGTSRSFPRAVFRVWQANAQNPDAVAFFTLSASLLPFLILLLPISASVRLPHILLVGEKGGRSCGDMF